MHRRLDRKVYHQKMVGVGVNGTPDLYYEGPRGLVWVEYKVKGNRPTALQRRWIERARAHGIPCWVVTFHDEGKVKIETALDSVEAVTFDDYVRMLELWVL